MGKYIVQLTKKAHKDFQNLKKSGTKADKEKVENFILELETHPRSGLGFPENLKYYDGEVWSRKINKKDRLVYEIFEVQSKVIVIQTLGHYSDK